MIVLITPTGARQAQFNLCSLYMQRQTYSGQVTWIIIDDCNPHTTDNIQGDFKPDWTIIKVYPIPLWNGQNTQSRNLSAGLDVMKGNCEDIEAVFIIEDDDYYKPFYIERMLIHLKGFWAAGEMNTIYYNVQHRRYADNNNKQHTSLFQLAFTIDAIPIFQQSLPATFIDAHFCMIIPRDKLNLFNDGTLSIGMKGMPGRKGIGAGHNMMTNHPPDYKGNYLKSLIGEQDAKFYEGYYGYNSQSQYSSLFGKRF